MVVSANVIAPVQYSGMNYALITDNLIVGSQPQKPEDIDHLKEEENVAYILNLQQDEDVEYWGIDLQSIIKRCKELGIRHMRRPVSNYSFNIKKFPGSYNFRASALLCLSMHFRQKISIQIPCEMVCLKQFHHWNGPYLREKEKCTCIALPDWEGLRLWQLLTCTGSLE